MFEILTHEYALVVYGIIIWEIFQHFVYKKVTFKERIASLGNSMKWGAFIVMFDDELVEIIENFFDIILEIDWYHYVGAGLFMDLIKSYFIKKVKD